VERFRQPWNAPSRSLIDKLGHAQAFGTPSILGITEALYLRTERGASVYDIGSPDGPQEIHTIADPGWFEYAARGRNPLVRHRRECAMVELYEVVGRRTV
jgi:hypothetical protein